jgi:hypothetical protein
LASPVVNRKTFYRRISVSKVVAGRASLAIGRPDWELEGAKGGDQ